MSKTLQDDETIVQVRDIKVGDLVNLDDDAILGRTDDNGVKVHPQVEFEYCKVMEIERETDDCIVLYFDNLAAGYSPEQNMAIKNRS